LLLLFRPAASDGGRGSGHAGPVLHRPGDCRGSIPERTRYDHAVLHVFRGRTAGAGRRRHRRRAETLTERTMAEAHAKNHDYHVVDLSPWPIIGATGAFILALGFVYYMHTDN